MPARDDRCQTIDDLEQGGAARGTTFNSRSRLNGALSLHQTGGLVGHLPRRGHEEGCTWLKRPTVLCCVATTQHNTTQNNICTYNPIGFTKCMDRLRSRTPLRSRVRDGALEGGALRVASRCLPWNGARLRTKPSKSERPSLATQRPSLSNRPIIEPTRKHTLEHICAAEVGELVRQDGTALVQRSDCLRC